MKKIIKKQNYIKSSSRNNVVFFLGIKYLVLISRNVNFILHEEIDDTDTVIYNETNTLLLNEMITHFCVYKP